MLFVDKIEKFMLPRQLYQSKQKNIYIYISSPKTYTTMIKIIKYELLHLASREIKIN